MINVWHSFLFICLFIICETKLLNNDLAEYNNKDIARRPSYHVVIYNKEDCRCEKPDKNFKFLIGEMNCLCKFDRMQHYKRLGYVLSNNIGLHKVHLNQSSWQNARKKCLSEGAHLAVINSKAEAIILSKMLQEAWQLSTTVQKRDLAYVGVKLIRNNGRKEWISIFGDSLKSTGFSEWARGAPNMPDDPQQPACVVLKKKGGLADTYCENRIPFICKAYLDKEQNNREEVYKIHTQ